MIEKNKSNRVIAAKVVFLSGATLVVLSVLVYLFGHALFRHTMQEVKISCFNILVFNNQEFIIYLIACDFAQRFRHCE